MSTVSDHDPQAQAISTELPDDEARAPAAGGPARNGGLFRAFWRWHFYASVLVVPIMFMLATTGLVILYKWQIDPAFNPGVMVVDVPPNSTAKPLAVQEGAVRTAYPDAEITAVQQGAEDRATFFTVSTADDETRNVYVNPYTATVTGSLDPDSLPSNIATVIHGNIVFGEVADVVLGVDPLAASGLTKTAWSSDDLTIGGVGDRIIELAVCWSIVMTLTGYYLYFRGRGARLRRMAAGAKAARMRNDHARYGALLGIGFLLLVLSGLPWTGLWGNLVQNFATGQGSSLWGEDPGAESILAPRLAEIGSSSSPPPWAGGAAPVPDSTGSGADATRIDIARAAAAAEADGAVGPFYITYPDGEKGVFSVLADQWHDKANPAATDVSKERTVHVDQYSGEVVGRYGYSDYSATAKVVTQGIALHEGRRLGSFNLVATTAFCLGVIFLCVTGPLLWWKRRPSGGGFAAPRGRMPIKATPWLLAALALLGVFMPLFGLSLLLVLAFDRFVLPRLPKLAKSLNRA